MPKERTHWILAEKVFQEILPDSPLKKIVGLHKNLYLAGAVIPDTPFYLLYGKSGKMMSQLGMRLHDNPLNSYQPLSDAINHHMRHVPDDVLALILGFIAHIHADASFHPLVYYLTGGDENERNREIRHRTLEAYLDIYYSARFPLQNRGLVSNVMTSLEMGEDRFLNLLSLFYFGREKKHIPEIKKSLLRHRMIQKLFDRDSVKITLKWLDFIPGMKLDLIMATCYPLVRPDPWSMFHHPFSYLHPVTGQPFRHSVRDLEEKMIRETLGIFAQIECHMKNRTLPELFSRLKGPDLCTGMMGKQISDMCCFSSRPPRF